MGLRVRDGERRDKQEIGWELKMNLNKEKTGTNKKQPPKLTLRSS